MNNAEGMISVVVPAYNEEKRLQVSLPLLWSEMGIQNPRFEILVIDDGSTDGTADVVMEFMRQHEGVRLIRYQQNRGKGYAVRTGVLASKGETVLFCDADLSTPVSEIGKLKQVISEGGDIAIGSRAVADTIIVKRQPFYRILMGKTFNKIVQVLATPGISDTQCGFKLFTRAAAINVFSDSRIDGFGFDVEILFLARKRGLSITEVGVKWLNSPDSRVHPIMDSARMLKELLVIRRNAMLGHYGVFSKCRTKIEAAPSE